MKKIILLILLLVCIPLALAYLGEYTIGETVSFSAQFNSITGSADSAANGTYVVFNTGMVNVTSGNGTSLTPVSGYDGFFKANFTIPAGSENGLWSIRINGSVTGGESPATVTNFKVISNSTDEIYDQTATIILEVDSIEENQAIFATNFSQIPTNVWAFIVNYLNPAGSTLNASDTLKTIAENTEAGGR